MKVIIKQIDTYFNFIRHPFGLSNFHYKTLYSHSYSPLIMWLKIHTTDVLNPILDIPFVEFFESCKVESNCLEYINGLEIEIQLVSTETSELYQVRERSDLTTYIKIISIESNANALWKNEVYIYVSEANYINRSSENEKFKNTIKFKTNSGDIYFRAFDNLIATDYTNPEWKIKFLTQAIYSQCYIKADIKDDTSFEKLNGYRHSINFYNNIFKTWNEKNEETIKRLFKSDEIKTTSSGYYNLDNLENDAFDGFPDARWNID